MVSSPTSRALGSWVPFLFFITRHDGLDGEACSEEKVNLAMGADTKRTRLQIASLFFDNIPPFVSLDDVKRSFNPTKLSSASVPRKRVSLSMTLEKDQYLKVFGSLGKRRDLTHLSMPVDDGCWCWLL